MTNDPTTPAGFPGALAGIDVPAESSPAAKAEIGWPVFWSLGTPRGDYIPALHGIQGIYELEKMALTDETIGGIMWLIESTVPQGSWDFIACKNGKPSKDRKAQKMADFFNTLFCDMDHSWSSHLVEAVTMVWAGHAPCEIVLKQRDGVNSRFKDGFWGIKALPLRDQTTIWNWVYKGRDLVGMRQVSIGGSADIPMWKVINYRLRNNLDNPRGRSLFYNAYRSWKLKCHIQDSEAIGIDRDLCGLPIFRIPKEDIELASRIGQDGKPTPEAMAALQRINNAQKAVRDMRFNKTGGLVIPSDPFSESENSDSNSSVPQYDFKIVTTAGQRSIDCRTAVKDYDRAIARTAMMQFLHLGDRSSGSYGLSDDQSTLAVRSIGAINKRIAEEFDKAIALICDVNGFNPVYMPMLQPPTINKETLNAIGQFLSGVGRASQFVGSDAQARSAILTMAGITHDPDVDPQQAAQQQADQAQPTLDPQNPVQPASPDDEGQSQDQGS